MNHKHVEGLNSKAPSYSKIINLEFSGIVKKQEKNYLHIPILFDDLIFERFKDDV